MDGKREISGAVAGLTEVSDIGTLAVTLSWTPPTTNADSTPLTDLAAYNVYYRLLQGTDTNEIYLSNPGLAAYTVQNLTSNTYYFVVTANSNAGAESSFPTLFNGTLSKANRNHNHLGKITCLNK